jgi:hypothetical protein
MTVDFRLALPRFEHSVLELDVGHQGRAREVLLQRARTLIKALLPDLGLPRSHLRLTCRWHGLLLGQIDRLLARCWEISAMIFLAEIYSMNDLQRQQVVRGSLSMDASRCFDRFTQQLLESRSPAVKYLGMSRAQAGQFMVQVPQAPNPVFLGSQDD